jgi:hypothetical protein
LHRERKKSKCKKKDCITRQNKWKTRTSLRLRRGKGCNQKTWPS